MLSEGLRPWVLDSPLTRRIIKPFESLTASITFISFAMLSEGFEPPITASKAVVISISLREQLFYYSIKF